jgi:uncharacterized protein (DUF924 family)
MIFLISSFRGFHASVFKCDTLPIYTDEQKQDQSNIKFRKLHKDIVFRRQPRRNNVLQAKRILAGLSRLKILATAQKTV